MCNTYCFSTATMVARKCLNVTLSVQCLPCFNYLKSRSICLLQMHSNQYRRQCKWGSQENANSCCLLIHTPTHRQYKNGRLQHPDIYPLEDDKVRNNDIWSATYCFPIVTFYSSLHIRQTPKAMNATVYREQRNSILSLAYDNLPFFWNNKTTNGVLCDVVHASGNRSLL